MAAFLAFPFPVGLRFARLPHHPTAEMTTGKDPEAGRSTPQPVLASSDKLDAQGSLETAMLVAMFKPLVDILNGDLLLLQAYIRGGRLPSRQHCLLFF